ncbi:MAG: DUF1956 domain-containing protein [Geobacter sp.]|nr:DUF1956 domain-containing protein [Geobacter sp.]
MTRKRSVATKEKLLAAASDVFLEKGYRDATVAEICARAEANIASINYHFGSKETLYQEAWRHSFAQSIKAHPQDGGVSEAAPAEERLRGQMRALIERIADENTKDFFISQMEFVNPTGLLAEVMRSEFVPLREKTLAVVRELLGPQATEQQVAYCETCIISICLHPLLVHRVRKRARQGDMPVVIEDLGDFADHVTTFALAGLAAVRDQARQGEGRA